MNESPPKLPFIQGDVGKKIGRGFAESEVFEFGEEWVIKITYKGGNTFEKLLENKADYEFFKSRLGEHVPETQFIRGQDAEGNEVNVVRQQRINGTPLIEFAPEDIHNNQLFRQELASFFMLCVEMWNKDGRIPDLIGPKNGRSLFNRFHPEFCPNLMYDKEENRIYLVDISAKKQYFSKEAKFPFRIVQERIVKRMQQFIQEVNQTQTRDKHNSIY